MASNKANKKHDIGLFKTFSESLHFDVAKSKLIPFWSVTCLVMVAKVPSDIMVKLQCVILRAH